MSLFSRKPGWLYSALGFDEAEVPTRMAVDEVESVLDVGQGGWGLGANWRTDSFSKPASDPEATEVLEAVDRDLVRIAWLTISTTTAAAGPYQVMIQGDVLAVATILTEVTGAGGAEVFGHTQLFGSLDPIVVPPGWSLRARLNATGAGETVLVRYTILEARSGFKAI